MTIHTVNAPTTEKSVADPGKGPLSEVCIVFPPYITLSGMTLTWGSMGQTKVTLITLNE
jgi:hypothetical protein